MCIVAKQYMNNAILKLSRKFNLSESVATQIVKESFLYDSLLLYPEETVHDDLDETVDILYQDFISA